MAAGNQRCTGIRAALPTPKANSPRSNPTAGPVTLPSRMPPGLKETVPAN